MTPWWPDGRPAASVTRSSLPCVNRDAGATASGLPVVDPPRNQLRARRSIGPERPPRSGSMRNNLESLPHLVTGAPPLLRLSYSGTATIGSSLVWLAIKEGDLPHPLPPVSPSLSPPFTSKEQGPLFTPPNNVLVGSSFTVVRVVFSFLISFKRALWCHQNPLSRLLPATIHNTTKLL